MECKRCGAIWEVAPDFDYPSKCPFCGKLTSGNDKDTEGILKKILDTYGVDILGDRKRLSSLISDLLISQPQDLHALYIAAYEGIGDYFLKAVNSDDIGRKAQLSAAHKFIKDVIGMNDQKAELIINAFSYAVGIGSFKNNRDWQDNDNVYYNLAELYEKREEDEERNRLYGERNTPIMPFSEKSSSVAQLRTKPYDTISMKLYKVSADTGNIKAIEKYVTKIGQYNWQWRKVINAETWFKWNNILVTNSKDSHVVKQAKANVLIARLYGIGTDIDLKNTEKELNEYHFSSNIIWFEGVNENYIVLERAVRRLCELIKPTSFDISEAISCINEASKVHFSYTNSIQKCLNDEGTSCRIIELFDDPYKRNEIEKQALAESKETLQGNISYNIAIFYKDRKEKEKYNFWLGYSIKHNNLIAKYDKELDLAEILIKKNDENIRREGIKIVENIIEELWKWNNKKLDVNLKNAFKILKRFREPELLFLKGKAHYYGFGCKASVKKAIKCFEAYIEYNENKFSLSEDKKNTLIMAIPFLTECLYENLLKKDDELSLRKLEFIADYYEFALARRYLARYYDDCTATFYDVRKWEKYNSIAHEINIYKSGRLTIIPDSRIQNHIAALSTVNNNKIMQEPEIRIALYYRDHFLLEVVSLPKDHNNMTAFIKQKNELYNMMALQFYDSTYVNFPKNKLRAKIFLENSFESFEIMELSTRTLKSYSAILKDEASECYHSDSKIKKERAATIVANARRYIELAREKGEDVFKESQKLDAIELRIYYFEWNSGKMQYLNDLIAVVERIASYDESSEISSLIGEAFILGNKGDQTDRSQGFAWLNKYYLEFNSHKIEESNKIGATEYLLGACYLFGDGSTKNIEKGLELWKKAVSHLEKEAGILSLLGGSFFEGEIEDRGEIVHFLPDYTTAFAALSKSADLGNADACYYLARMYGAGLGIEKDNRKALYLFQKAAYKGNDGAREWLAEHNSKGINTEVII